MELQNLVIGALVAAFFAVFTYLLQHFIQSFRKENADLRAENEEQGLVLVRLESDLNEAWYQIRKLQGVDSGRRKCRFTKRWRGDGYVSRTWQDVD